MEAGVGPGAGLGHQSGVQRGFRQAAGQEADVRSDVWRATRREPPARGAGLFEGDLGVLDTAALS
eukprot:4354473-Lingulodinium_polyedra.AAC.1